MELTSKFYLYSLVSQFRDRWNIETGRKRAMSNTTQSLSHQVVAPSARRTSYTAGTSSATAAGRIQQAARKWAGRAGRGVIGRARGPQRWPPLHSTNELCADRTRVHRLPARRCQLDKKKIPDSTFLGPSFFFGRVIIRERIPLSV